jgi:hypothetical protein
MRNTLLIIHIMAAATWIGASTTFLFATSRMRSRGHESAASFMSVFEAMGRMYFPPAAVIMLITGVWLVIDSSVYAFEDPFVVIGTVAVIAGAFLGIRIFGPITQQIQQAHGAQDESTLSRAYKRFMGFGLLDITILAFAVVSMVTKLGT